MRPTTTILRSLTLGAVFLLTATAVEAQTGIGTTTVNSSARLEVTSANKGVLLPRVALTGITDGATITLPATSLLVWNTATVTGLTPGYYYNSGTPASPVWARMATAPTLDPANGLYWGLTGNSGTNPSTNFVGTTDAKNLNFRVGNEAAGHIGYTDSNTSFGYVAGRDLTGSGSNAFFGNRSGMSTTTGTQNTMMGRGSGENNLNGTSNTFIGYQAGNANVGGYFNTFLGAYSGQATTSSSNTFLGYQSGMANTTGNFNVFVGFQSGVSTTTGDQNTFLGSHAGDDNTTGDHNTFVGTFSGYQNTTGHHNVFMGLSGSASNTTGSENQFIGVEAGNANLSGNRNQFEGYQAGNKSTADNNKFSGYQAGLNTTSGANNHFDGYQAGLTNTTGSNNMGVGYLAGPTTAALTKAAAIGYNAKVSQSNSLVLGGTGADAVSVGIGTTAPAKTLEVAGTAGTPNVRLGSLAGTGTRLVTADANGDLSATITSSAGTAWSILGNSGTNPSTNFLGTIDAQGLAFRTSNTEKVRITTAGLVGVGVTAPATLLANTATATVGDDSQPTMTNGLNWAGSGDGYVASVFNSGATASDNGLAVKIARSSSDAQALNVSTGTTAGTAGAPLLSVLGNTHVGLGTNTPTARLHIVADLNSGLASDDIQVNSYTGTSAGGHALVTYHARGTLASPQNLQNGDELYEILSRGRVNGAYSPLSEVLMYYRGNGTTQLSDMIFNTSAAERMRINENGNVGIGTGTPATLLDVNGTVQLGTNGTTINGIIRGTGTLGASVSVPANSTATGSFSITNAAVGGTVTVSPSANLPTGVAISFVRVSAAGIVTIGFINATGSSVSVPTSTTFATTIIQ